MRFHVFVLQVNGDVTARQERASRTLQKADEAFRSSLLLWLEIQNRQNRFS